LESGIVLEKGVSGEKRMAVDVRGLLAQAEGSNYQLHKAHINPQFAKALHTIGFDRCYVRAEGPHLWDQHGTRYLDMMAGYGVFNLGRNHPEIRQALIDFMNLDYPSLVQLEAPLLSGLLARELKKRMPNGLDMVYFTNSGTEGIETAIKLAHCATGRPGIIHCSKAFHGLSNGSLSLNGDESFRRGFAPLLPQCRRVPFNDLDALEAGLCKGDVAAFVVESIQGKGVNIPAPGYLREAAALCRRYRALFIADEVQCGLGRTGRFLALEHDGDVDPDIVVLSKALSGGYVPVGAVLTRRWIYKRVFSSLDRAVVHSSTFGQGSLAMVAGLATLQVMDELDLVARAERLGNQLGEALRALQARFEFLREVRWRGCMIGIELGCPQSLGLKIGWSGIHKIAPDLFPQVVTIPLLDDHHILTQVAGHQVDVIKLLPPLVLSEEDVNWFISGFETVMERLEHFPGPLGMALGKLSKMSLTSRC
jgi:ornithine--oxo-acid transaminase